MKTRQRSTIRKALIEKILAEDYAGGPVLLEELRWKVLTKQYGPSFVEMTDAKQKSLARTIREHFPQLQVRKIRLDDAPAEMIARAGLYRVKSRESIEQFLAADQQHVFLNIGFPDHDWDYRYHPGQQRVTVGCYFLDRFVNRVGRGDLNFIAIAQTILPKSHTLTLVQNGTTRPSHPLRSLAQVPWCIHFFHRRPGGTWCSIDRIDSSDRLPF